MYIDRLIGEREANRQTDKGKKISIESNYFIAVFLCTYPYPMHFFSFSRNVIKLGCASHRRSQPLARFLRGHHEL